MTTLIIGSEAARVHIPMWREPKDYDVFSDRDEIHVSKKVDSFWHPTFSDIWDFSGARYATLDELFTIKLSHAPWVLKNGSWEKHMNDIVEFKRIGAQFQPDLYKSLYKVWEERHGKKKVNLQMDKDSFFTDAVERIWDHDSLHLSVAYGDRPIYEECFKDGQEIEMDMAKIKALPFEQQIKLFREEVYATALERWVCPSDYKFSPRKAYAWALKKTITSLTKGWSSLFLSLHYDTMRVPDIDYVQHHLAKKHLLIPLEN